MFLLDSKFCWPCFHLTNILFHYCRVPWPQACHSSVLWCHTAQDWHPSLSRTPTVCLYWRNSRGSNSNNNRHSRQTQVRHTSQTLCGEIRNLFSLVIQILALLRVYNLKKTNKPFFSSGLSGTSGQTPQLFHSQTGATSTTTALPGNTPLYNTPLTPMTPITPATPASESSGIVPQLQYVGNIVRDS